MSVSGTKSQCERTKDPSGMKHCGRTAISVASPTKMSDSVANLPHSTSNSNSQYDESKPDRSTSVTSSKHGEAGWVKVNGANVADIGDNFANKNKYALISPAVVKRKAHDANASRWRQIVVTHGGARAAPSAADPASHSSKARRTLSGGWGWCS